MITNEKHYKIPELAKRWNMPRSTVYRWFVGEKGVIEIPIPTARLSRKKTRTDLLIPESVVERVYCRHRKA